MNIDVVGDGLLLPRLERGTRLTFSPVGAYNIAVDAVHPRRPAVVMVRADGRVDLIRRAETIDDIEAGESSGGHGVVAGERRRGRAFIRMSFRMPAAGRIGFHLRDEARAWGLAWAGIFCLGDARSGGLVSLLVIGASLATRPSVPAGGLICVVAGRLFEVLLGRKAGLRMAVNCLLLGLGVGFGFDFGPSFAALCMVAAAYVGLVSGLMPRDGPVSGLPMLSLPFATGYILLQLATPWLGGLAGHGWTAMTPLWPAFDAALPALPKAFFTNLGLWHGSRTRSWAQRDFLVVWPVATALRCAVPGRHGGGHARPVYRQSGGGAEPSVRV